MPAPHEPAEDRLVVQLEGKPTPDDRIISYRINSNYIIPTDGWDFVVFSEDNPRELRRRWRPLQPLTLNIAGHQQVLGRIDGTEPVGESGKLLRVFGRDYLSDLVDSTVDPTFQVKKNQDIGAFLLELLKPWGIVTVFSDADLTRDLRTGKRAGKSKKDKPFKSARLEDSKAEEGQGVLEYAAKIIARHNATIQPAGTRDAICVDQPNYDQAPLHKLRRTLAGDGNLKTGAARRDYAGVPTVTIGRGRVSEASTPGKQVSGTTDLNEFAQRPASFQENFDTTAGQPHRSARTEYPTFDKNGPSKIGGVREVQRAITSDDGIVIVREKRFDPKQGDNTIYGFDFPVYKPLFYRDRSSQNDAQFDASVKRVIAEKLRDTLTYACSVRGHVDPVSGAIYSVDTMAEVFDDVDDVDETLWMVERTLVNDGSGPITEMVFLRAESYVF